MAESGTAFNQIKQSLLKSLATVPYSEEIGLRVFDDSGSRLAVPYQHGHRALSSELAAIVPQGSTFIGQSLLDATQDLVDGPLGEKRLILITDGEGSDQDIALAQEAAKCLEQHKNETKCYLVVFSSRQNVRRETPIGQIADILNCEFNVPSEQPSAFALQSVLQKIITLDFYFLWIIVSATAFFLLFLYCAYLIFATLDAWSLSPKNSRLGAVLFLGILIPPVMGAHIGALLGWDSIRLWWISLLFLALFISLLFIDNQHRKRHLRRERR
jgi:hypothetical protein